MAAAVLLTGLALVGVLVGASLHHGISHHLAAAGGLLLLVIAFVWIVPEIAGAWGWPRACLTVALAALLLAALDSTLTRHGHSLHHGVIAPLLAATAIHSLLDGWSIRALAAQPVPGAIVPIGLSLHKLPEGFALGWVLRRTLLSRNRAIAFGAFAEMFTLAGAAFQPTADRSALAHFGPAWTPTILSVIAGAFLFLACHALLPYFTKKKGDTPGP
jgi:zinc transporter ZupT